MATAEPTSPWPRWYRRLNVIIENTTSPIINIRTRIIKRLNYRGFDWLVFFVTASGFYSASYSLFATNVISPALAYVWWNDHKDGERGFVIDIVTIAASLSGMLVFGLLSDLWGRKKLYGIELILVIVGTLSIAQTSAGFQSPSGNGNSMNIYGWIIFWRIVLGFGIGAEYPVTAVIASEWSATKWRGVMLACVFSMQSLGQLSAYAVCFGVTKYVGKPLNLPSNSEHKWDYEAVIVDKIWRAVVGVGAFPAALSIILRFTIIESPRWSLDVLGDRKDLQQLKDKRAVQMMDTGNFGPTLPRQTSSNADVTEDDNNETTNHDGADPQEKSDGIPTPPQEPVSNPVDTNPILSIIAEPKEVKYPQFTCSELRRYLCRGQAWRHLVGLSISWLLLDVCFYGLGLNNPRTISRIWKDNEPNITSKLPDWNTELIEENTTIYQVLMQNSTRNMLTISTGTVPGAIAIILLINYVPRARFMSAMFAFLALFFGVTGGALFSTHVYEGEHHELIIAMYALVQFLFNLGPNALTWILAAEVFPTKYRGTCYGIAAASGKLGAIIILLAMKYKGLTAPKVPRVQLAALLCSFAGIMLLGAICAWFLPNVQVAVKDTTEDSEGELVPNARETRAYPFFKKYENLVLETIVAELDKSTPKRMLEDAPIAPVAPVAPVAAERT